MSGTIRFGSISSSPGVQRVGVYYKCLCGDSEHLAVMEGDAVAIQDRLGRNWICHPIEPQLAENLPLPAHVSEVFTADATARRQGLAQQGTRVRVYYCEDERDLAERLNVDAGLED